MRKYVRQIEEETTTGRGQRWSAVLEVLMGGEEKATSSTWLVFNFDTIDQLSLK